MFVFIVGTGRCGSTLLVDMLARHPEVGFISNLEEKFPTVPRLGRYNNFLYRRLPTRFTGESSPHFIPAEGWRVQAARISPAITATTRDLVASDATPWLAARYRRFFASRAAYQRRPVFLHKYTGWPRARFIQAALPEAKFVHIVRDGRAVANSFLQMPWWGGYAGPNEWPWGPLPDAYEREWQSSNRSFVVLAGINWKLLIDAHEQAEAAVAPDSWLNVRYEDFLDAPRETLLQLLDFMALEHNSEFERGLARHEIRVGRKRAFEQDLDGDDVRRLESSLADHLSRWGYSSSASGSKPGA